MGPLRKISLGRGGGPLPDLPTDMGPPLQNQALSRLKLFLALSRTPHGLLDLAAPAFGAFLWLGGPPALGVAQLGLITAFAGYTAVYALNDLIDLRTDREKIRRHLLPAFGGDLDSIYIRHPLAHGLLRFREAILWTAGWASLALIGAFLLNPVCAFIFLAAGLLEAVYCLLLEVSFLRTIFSGMVKTSGGIAAVFAVDPHPDPSFLLLLFAWLFLWEIGGQNIPNDWGDVEADRVLKARTIPVRFGPRIPKAVILGSLGITVALSLILCRLAPSPGGGWYPVGALAAGAYFLLCPALGLIREGTPRQASILFNRASFYPLAMLAIAFLTRLI